MQSSILLPNSFSMETIADEFTKAIEIRLNSAQPVSIHNKEYQYVLLFLVLYNLVLVVFQATRTTVLTNIIQYFMHFFNGK